MMNRWAWLDLDRVLANKNLKERVLYRHFIPMYLHYFGQFLQCARGDDPHAKYQAERVFQSVSLGFVDELACHQLQPDTRILTHYDIELAPCLREPEMQHSLRGEDSYATARAIFEDCFNGLDPQQQLLQSERTWFELLQHRANQVGRQWFK
ncbi:MULTISPECIES: hypothetical protein [Ferrimonas]|uniref:hypothetical protein n=1 Tax=Ferrimonas TaxID=44011 RepID=UPI0004127739|nr:MULTISPECIES: hypothetical protein [Ferrimonas]USD39227.1 hypothetical protein J8Z22_09050 [Ferrimonas sp. SCSIO 43195]